MTNRRTVSISVDVYDRLRTWSHEHDVAMSQVVERIADLVLDGSITVESRKPRKARIGEPPLVYLRVPSPRAPALKPGFCGLCLADIPDVKRREPIGRDGGLVAVCESCCSTPVRVR